MNDKTRRAIAFLLLKVAAIAAVTAVLMCFVVTVRICRDTDMYPNLRDGDLVLLQRTHDVSFDDVILYEHDGIEYFGRIVAVAGDTVAIDDANGLTVNGNVTYNTLPYATKMPDGGRREFAVGDGEVFVLGDFRDGARDSREFGCVRREDAIGRQIYLMRWRGF